MKQRVKGMLKNQVIRLLPTPEVFFIIHRLFGFKFLGYSPSDTPGLASLAVGVFFLGGIIMIILGVIGEYIGRIYFEVKKRPFYIIDEIYNEQKEKSQ